VPGSAPDAPSVLEGKLTGLLSRLASPKVAQVFRGLRLDRRRAPLGVAARPRPANRQNCPA